MDDHEFKIPDNVVVRSSVKHSLLFPFAHLLITHGGHGTIMRALSYGLPIICLPMGRDQDDNAIKVAMKGCGIKLSPGSGPPKIQKAVNRILGDSTFRINARKMQDEINKPNNMEKVIEEISDLVKYQKAATK